VASVFVLSSCLKNTDRLGFIGDKGSIVSEIATANEANPVFAAVSTVPAVETIDVLKVAFHNAKNLPSGDIKIKLVLDPTIITDYNAANGTNYVPLPFTAFSFSDPTLEITIPKGTYGIHTLQATVTKSFLNLTQTYALGFKIQSVSEGVISDLANSELFVLGVKNIYDGRYAYVSGLVTRYLSPGVPANDALSGPLLAGVNPDLLLATAGTNTSNFTGLSGTGVGLTWSGGTSGVAGIDGLQLAVDPATNLTTMTSSANPTLTNWAGHVNKYDPATKTLTLAFRWNPTANVREYEVVLKYKGPRP
jgi:hypothetical protein